MVILSCSGKFHAFNLAEQLARHGQLTRFYTTYAWQRNRIARRFVSRTDKEQIPAQLIRSCLPLAVTIKKNLLDEYTNAVLFDRWVAAKLSRQAAAYNVFIGWSGRSLASIQHAKTAGKVTIVERGSSHICYQNAMLQEEYSRFSTDFRIDPRVIDRELQEYEVADFISIPSQFVRKTFIDQGIAAEKLLLNNYGVSSFFKPLDNTGNADTSTRKYIILYLGSITIQKGLIYLFEALSQLPIPTTAYEFWLVGSIAAEMESTVNRYRQENWLLWGHINHYELADIIGQADVGVQPSIQEGLSMVIPQMLGCGLPVIASYNTGATDLIEEGVNGFVVPIRSAELIADRIMQLYQSPERLSQMKIQAATSQRDLSWAAYGNRYMNTLQRILS
jgi:glycosyltransferase involved in cell wall biosynthesis